MQDISFAKLRTTLRRSSYLYDAAKALLPYSAESWPREQLHQLWSVSQSTARLWVRTFLQRGILISADYERVMLAQHAREELFWMLLLEESDVDEAERIARIWLQRHAEQGQGLTVAWAYDLLGHVGLLRQDEALTVRALRCSRALRGTHGDDKGAVMRSWSLGIYLIRSGRRDEGQPLVAQAAQRARRLGMQEADFYRGRLAQYLQSLEETDEDLRTDGDGARL